MHPMPNVLLLTEMVTVIFIPTVLPQSQIPYLLIGVLNAHRSEEFAAIRLQAQEDLEIFPIVLQ